MALPDEETVAVVVNPTGNIGNGVVRAFLEHGVAVVAPCATDAGMERLGVMVGPALARSGRLCAVKADVRTEEGSRQVLEEALARFGHIDHVVGAMGPYHSLPPMHEMTPEQWRNVMVCNVDPHFLVWRALAAHMLDRDHTTWTFLTGCAAENPNTGATGMRVETDELYDALKPENALPSRLFARIILNLVNKRNAHVRGQLIRVEDIHGCIKGARLIVSAPALVAISFGHQDGVTWILALTEDTESVDKDLTQQ
eukprot:jgi/Chlat1/8136/Chrsp75S09199